MTKYIKMTTIIKSTGKSFEKKHLRDINILLKKKKKDKKKAQDISKFF